MKILFMGTTVFSNVVLQELINGEYNIVGVVTQPDRPFGRKKILKAPATKELALEHKINVLQPEKIKDAYEDIKALNPDIIITCAYGQFVPVSILEIPRLRALNVHASLLPKYRGGAPIHKSIINGDTKTGVTLQFMEKGMDTGDVLAEVIVDIDFEDTFGDLEAKLMEASKELIKKDLPKYINGELKPVKQDENEVTFAYAITREEEYVSFDRDGLEVYNQIRGLIPWPTSYGVLDGQNIKFHGVKFIEKDHNYPSGKIVEVNEEGTLVACKTNLVLITSIQPAGKPKMKNIDIVNGFKNQWEGKQFE